MTVDPNAQTPAERTAVLAALPVIVHMIRPDGRTVPVPSARVPERINAGYKLKES